MAGARRTIDPDGKRRRILDAARLLFAKDGFETTTVSRVAADANVAVGSVYRQFATKLDLLHGVRDDFEHRFIDAMAGLDLDKTLLKDRFRAIFTAIFETAAQYPEFSYMMSMPFGLPGRDDVEPRGAHTRAAIAEMMRDDGRSGEDKPFDADVAAAIVYAMVDGALRMCFVENDGRDPERYIDVLTDAVSRWMDPVTQN